MKIKTLKDGRSFPLEVEEARTLCSRTIGLMFRSPEEMRGRALFISPCSAIHTFFMRFPITAVFVKRMPSPAGEAGERFTSVRVLKTALPYRFFLPVPDADGVLEYPANEAHGIEQGDMLVMLP